MNVDLLSERERKRSTKLQVRYEDDGEIDVGVRLMMADADNRFGADEFETIEHNGLINGKGRDQIGSKGDKGENFWLTPKAFNSFLSQYVLQTERMRFSPDRTPTISPKKRRFPRILTPIGSLFGGKKQSNSNGKKHR